MKKIFLFTVCAMLFAVSCDNENWVNNKSEKSDEDIPHNGNQNNQEDEKEYHFWDRERVHTPFAIFDSENNNILEIAPEAIYDIKIMYDGNNYVYEGITRATALGELMIYTKQSSPYIFVFGELDWDMSGSYTIYFRENEWKVDFNSQRNVETGLDVTITIDGEVTEPVEIGTFLIESGEYIYKAYPLIIK